MAGTSESPAQLTNWLAWPEARRLALILDNGQAPREKERQHHPAQGQAKSSAIVLALTMGEVWTDCIDKRRPLWGVLHHRDHLSKAAPGGLPDATAPGGPDTERIEAWYVEQAKIVFAA